MRKVILTICATVLGALILVGATPWIEFNTGRYEVAELYATSYNIGTVDSGVPLAATHVGAAAAVHVHAGADITSGSVDGDRLPALSETKRGGAPATGSPSGKFLKDDGTWATPAGTGDAYPVGSVFIAVVSTNPATLLGYGTWAAIGTGQVLVGINAADPDFDVVEETGGAKTVASSGSVAAPTFTGAALAGHSHGVGTYAAANESAHTHAYTDVVNHVHDIYELRSATTGSAATNIALNADTSSTRGSGSGYQTANPTGGVASGTTAAGSAHTHSMSGSSESVTAGTPAGTNSAPAYTGAATSVVQPYFVVYMWKRTA